MYLIVLYEQSPRELKTMPYTYLHRAQHVFDTGLQLDLLQRCILIPLDIFKKCMQNKTINTLLEAWLTFLSEDNPERVAQLLQAFPQFAEMYRTLYSMSKDMVKMMGFFSEELRMMDKNTVQYMIDEQQAEIDKQKVTIEEQAEKIGEQLETIDQQQATIDDQQATIDALQEQIRQLQARKISEKEL